MRVVIVGSRNRSEIADTPLVYSILDRLIDLYPKLMVVTRSCDRGVGKIIRTRRIDESRPGYPEFDMIEVSLRHYIPQSLPRNEYISDQNTLNATLLEIGEEFHLLMDDEPRGSMQDMLKRVTEASRPYALYSSQDNNVGYKQPIIPHFSTP